jgi:hypothetical protein
MYAMPGFTGTLTHPNPVASDAVAGCLERSVEPRKLPAFANMFKDIQRWTASHPITIGTAYLAGGGTLG